MELSISVDTHNTFSNLLHRFGVVDLEAPREPLPPVSAVVSVA